MAFVDCEGLDVSWSTMQSLFARNGDVLFNFQTQNILRTASKAMKHSIGCESLTEKLDWFFGGNGWIDCKEPDDFLQYYTDKIRTETTRKIVLPLPVRGPRGYRYDIVLATRITRGRNPWIKPMEDLKEIMGGIDPKS